MARKKKTAPPVEAAPEGLTRASQVESTSIDWLWRGRVSLPSFVLLAGRGGVGKSLLATDFAARLTTKGKCSHDKPTDGKPCNIVWLPAEDSIHQIVTPRLKAAGADMDRVYFAGLDAQGFPIRRWSFPHDVGELSALCKAVNASVVFLDPLASFCGGVDLNHQQPVRQLCTELYTHGHLNGITWFALAHPNKSSTGPMIDRIFGSASLVHCARSVMIAGNNPNEQGVNVLVHAKTNEGQLMPTWGYEIVAPLGHPVVRFLGTRDVKPDDLGAELGSPGERDALDDARTLLAAALGKGALNAVEIITEAKACGIGERTLRQAKRELGIVSKRVKSTMGDVHWQWEMGKGASR